MWATLGKQEFKKGAIYYFLLYLFVFFWSFFTLISFFTYSNINNLLREYSTKYGITILIYAKEKTSISENELRYFQGLPYVKGFEITPPQELFEMIKEDLELDLKPGDDLIANLPTLLKIWLDSPTKINELNREIKTWEQLTKTKIEIMSSNFMKLASFWTHLHYYFLVFLFLWNLFYLLVFFFINKTLNNYLRIQIETFQLLGGHVNQLRFIRFCLTVFPLIILFSVSFVLYYLSIQMFCSIFPFLKIVPNYRNIIDILFYSFYFVFMFILYPFFVIFLSFKPS